MKELPKCPECGSKFTYEDRNLIVCPECAYEWIPKDNKSDEIPEEDSITDAFGNTLVEGDTVTIIKDLKVKGASSKLKVGTKVKNIRIIEGDHNIACKIPGFGAMNLKSEFVKKA